MASFLAPGYIFEDRKVISQSECEQKRVRIINLERVDTSSDHYDYYYKTNKGLMKFTAFELARVLFFHNPHLVRVIYTANGLSGLAFVNRNQSPIKISFPNNTKYPVSLIGSKSSKTHLAWLILDREANKSAFSVFECFKKDNEKLGFRFSPPNLKDWLLDVSIIQNTGDDFFQVVRIENIVDAEIMEKFIGIEFHHPKNKGKNSQCKDSQVKKGEVPVNDIEPELDLVAIPASGRRLDIMRKKGFSFNVSGIQNVNFSKENLIENTSMSLPTEKMEPPKEVSGVGFSQKDGNAQEFNPTINQDNESIDTIDLPEKFSIFSEVIEKVVIKSGVQLIQEAKCYRFPEPKNNSKVIYQTKYEGQLKYFVAILEIKDNQLVLIEADTSNLITPKGASTLILALKEDAKTNFYEILQNFSDKGAQWSHDFINQRCNFFIPCRHPSLKEKGMIRTGEEYKEKWVSNIYEKLMEFNNIS